MSFPYPELLTEEQRKKMEDYVARMPTFNCCLCLKDSKGWGNNPYPIINKPKDGERCCDGCNSIVVFARIGSMKSKQPVNGRNWRKVILSENPADKAMIAETKAMMGFSG